MLLRQCIPLTGRRRPDSLLYRLLPKTLDCFGRQVLTAVSKGNMQRIARIVQRIYGSLVNNSLGMDTFEQHWRSIQQISAYEWLRLYGSTTKHGKSFIEFRKDVAHLRRMHSVICCGEPPYIPIPTLSIVEMDMDSDEGDTGYASIGASGTEGEGVLQMKEKLHRELSRIQIKVCQRGGNETDDIQFAFTPAQVDEVVHAAQTVQERLFVLLLLSFGLWIGGLSRLAYSVEVTDHLQAAGSDMRYPAVPDGAISIEKFGKRRCMRTLFLRRLRHLRHAKSQTPLTSKMTSLTSCSR